MSNLYLNLEIRPKSNEYFIKTDIKDKQIDNVLAEFYRASLNKGPDHSKFIEREVYHIQLKLDLEEDEFAMSSDTGNDTLTYELIREAIGNWKIKSKLELKVNKANLSE